MKKSVRFFEEYCQLFVTHARGSNNEDNVVWMAEKDKEKQFIIVLIKGHSHHDQAQDDYGHIGFAVKTRAEIDRIANKAKDANILAWPPTEEPYPVGYYCGVYDPDRRIIEFSYGQPLGPGSLSPA